MFLRVIKKRCWTVCEVCDKNSTPVLPAWINGLNKKYQGSAQRLYAIISMIADTVNGPTQLPKEISHEANKNHSIYELIAGDIRLLWFYSTNGNKVIICTGHYIKKGQKVDKQVIAQAIRIKKQYIADLASGNVVYL